MIPFIENCDFLSRLNNIIFANLIDGPKVPLIRLKQKFIDLQILEKQHVIYMEKYLKMFPLWEIIQEEPTKTQLTLF